MRLVNNQMKFVQGEGFASICDVLDGLPSLLFDAAGASHYLSIVLCNIFFHNGRDRISLP